MVKTSDIRTMFLDYYKSNDHAEIQSAPLVPDNDPSLLFINSGMVQFKNIFTGKEVRDYKRAVTAQKCVRAGGKHNDLENVGYTARHHTFFEMLGNFSFGDYFKEQAIQYAWNMTHKELGLAKEKLLVTVYADDDEAAALWRKIAGLSDDRIIRIGTSDNFWQMGDTGPCGPCSEIFFDHGEGIAGGPPGSPDEDGDRFIEIWNLVFMQYEQFEGGKREALPKPSIDTGMGLERIAAVLQGKHNNYDIDLMRAIIDEIADLTGQSADGANHASHKVIADHLRSASFLIADGVLPSNEGRGYVLRRIMRRGMRHAHLLESKTPLMHRLVGKLVNLMGGHFTELQRAESLITETLRNEEERFQSLLTRGLGLLTKETDKLGDKGVLSGDIAFTLYDTYGFPLDLTQDILRNKGLSVDVTGFDSSMQAQREKARKAWAGTGGSGTDKIWFDLRSEFGATEFLGYQNNHAEAVVLAIIQDGKVVDKISGEGVAEIIVSQTPFYAESGGQMGDKGTIKTDKAEIKIKDTKKHEGLHVHIADAKGVALSVGDEVSLEIDINNRNALRRNHSATHLLHSALREVLGENVTQKGSAVAAKNFRFDFSYGKAMGDEDILQVEKIVNEQISVNESVQTQFMTPESAIESGALALFGEKYGEEVRVLSMGGVDSSGRYFSTELCGGTHVKRTGDIGYFRIISEEAVASGVRRIWATTGTEAVSGSRASDYILRDSANALKIPEKDVPKKIIEILDERKNLMKEIEGLRKQLALSGGKSEAKTEVKKIGEVSFAPIILSDVPAKQLRSIAEEKQKEIGSGIVIVLSKDDGKASVVVSVSKDLTDKYDAVALVKLASSAIGGQGGGGRPDMAQAGGNDITDTAMSKAITDVEAAL